MSKSSWSDIANDPEFKNLSPEDQKALKLHYAETEMVNDPEFRALSLEDQKAALTEFLTDPVTGAAPLELPEVHHDYKLSEVPGAAATHLIPSIGNALAGMWQTIADPAGTIDSLDKMSKGAAVNGLDAVFPGTKDRVIKEHPEAQQEVAAADAVGEFYKNRYGSGQGWLNTMAEDPAGFGMDMTTLLSPAAGPVRAGAQAALNAARVPAGVANAVINAGTIFSNPTRAVEGPTQGVGNVFRQANNLLHPQETMLIRKFGGPARAEDAVNHLNTAPTIVPGSPPNAAEALATMANPPVEAQGMLREAAKLRPDYAYRNATDTTAANLGAVDAVVPHPDLPAAIAARNARAELDYANAGIVHDFDNPPPHPVADINVTSDPILMDIMGRPRMNQVFDRARALAEQWGRQFQTGENVPAGPMPTGLYDHNGRPIMTNVPASFAEYPAQSMHFVKQAMDDLITDPEQFGIGASEVRALRSTRNNFINWFEDRNPAYRTARENFRDASRPIDQTRLLNYYRDKLTNLVTGDDAAKLNAQAFAAARDNGLNEALGNSSISRATGQKRVRHERELLDPAQMQALDTIQANQARAKVAAEQAATPSSVAGDLTAAGQAVQAPGFINHLTTAANFLSRTAQGHMNRHIANNIADAAPNPRAVAALVQQALEWQGRTERFENRARAVGNALATPQRQAPAVFNALSADRKEKKRRKTKAELEKENQELLRHL